MKEAQSNDKPVDNSKGPKRGRASPEPEDESIATPSPKKQKTEAESDDATILEEDDYSILDAMLWGSSFPGITESSSPSSPKKDEQLLPDIGSILDAAPMIPKPRIPKSKMPKSWDFTIFEDNDAGTDDYTMVGREAPWISEYDDENKENVPPEFDVAIEEANELSESEEYDFFVWQRQFPRAILGELQQN